MHRWVNVSPMLGIIFPNLWPFEIHELLSLQFQWISSYSPNTGMVRMLLSMNT